MTIQNLKIDKEFQNKIPPLTQEELQQLEDNIVADGEVYEPLIIWNGVIVDGHNRYKILCKHPDIPYRLREMNFQDKWEAFDWMYKNQLGRRNLTEQQRSYMIGKMYEARKKSVGEHRGNQYTKMECAQNEHIPTGRIGEQIGKELGIGNGTVRRAYDFAKGVDAVKEIDNEAAEKILSGKVKIPKGSVAIIKDLDADSKKEVVEAIQNDSDIPISRKWDNHKKAHERDKHISDAVTSLYSETVPIYGIDNLVEDIANNCKSFYSSVKAMIESRKEVIKTYDDKKAIHKCIREELISKLNQLMEGIINEDI